MTREIIEGAKEVVIPYIMEKLRHYNVDGNGEADAEEAKKDLEEIFGLAIKALEQEPVLDKIRAEIEKLQKMCDKNDLNLMAQYSAFGMVLEILDKYKAESEDIDGANE